MLDEPTQRTVVFCCDEVLKLETTALESLYGGHFASSTQIIKLNDLVILRPTQYVSFFRNLPPYLINLR